MPAGERTNSPKVRGYENICTHVIRVRVRVHVGHVSARKAPACARTRACGWTRRWRRRRCLTSVPLSLLRIWVIASTSPASPAALLEGLLERTAPRDRRAAAARSPSWKALPSEVRRTGRFPLRGSAPSQTPTPTCCSAPHVFTRGGKDARRRPEKNNPRARADRARIPQPVLLARLHFYLKLIKIGNNYPCFLQTASKTIARAIWRKRKEVKIWRLFFGLLDDYLPNSFFFFDFLNLLKIIYRRKSRLIKTAMVIDFQTFAIDTIRRVKEVKYATRLNTRLRATSAAKCTSLVWKTALKLSPIMQLLRIMTLSDIRQRARSHLSSTRRFSPLLIRLCKSQSICIHRTRTRQKRTNAIIMQLRRNPALLLALSDSVERKERT